MFYILSTASYEKWSREVTSPSLELEVLGHTFLKSYVNSSVFLKRTELLLKAELFPKEILEMFLNA